MPSTPSIVIGLGGSGDWVLRHIKHSLKRGNNGAMPREVVLIGIDTDRAVAGDNNQGGLLANAPQGADSPDGSDYVIDTLDATERVELAGDLYEWGTKIQAARRSPQTNRGEEHVKDWFVADEYIGTLARPVWRLSNGASMLRQFGRLGLFDDVKRGEAQSAILSSLREGITRVHQSAPPGAHVEVLIVASLAGGTGAGLFLDTGHLACTLMETVAQGRPFIVRAFLFLPSVFSTIPDGNNEWMKARGFAAMREANRFDLEFMPRIGYPMKYSLDPKFPQWLNGSQDKRLFDHIFYIDNGIGLNGVAPQNAHFPMLAEAIVSVLDTAEGGRAWQSMTANTRGVRANMPGVSVCSGIGSFTYVLPVQHWKESFTIRLAKDFLELLAPINEGRIGLHGARNPTRGGRAGKDSARDFLKAIHLPDQRGSLVYATQLTNKLQLMFDSYQPNDRTQVAFLASRGISLLDEFEPIADDEQAKTVKSQVLFILQMQLSDVQGSKVRGEKPSETLPKIVREVSQRFDELLGQTQGDGSTAGGTYLFALTQYKKLHIERFKTMLELFVDQVLNEQSGGGSQDVKAGRLGYLQDFATELPRALSAFSSNMRGISAERSSQGLLVRAQQKRLEAERRMRNSQHQERKVEVLPLVGIAGLVIILSLIISVLVSDLSGWWLGAGFGVIVAGIAVWGLSRIEGDGYSSQRAYLEASTLELDIRKTDILLNEMINTVDLLTKEAETLLKSIDRWADAIRTSQSSSLYQELVDDYERAATQHDKNKVSQVRAFVDDRGEEDVAYLQCTEGDNNSAYSGVLRTLAAGVSWDTIDFRLGEYALKGFTITFNGRTKRFEIPQRQEANTLNMAEALKDLCAPVFEPLEQRSIIEYFRSRYADPSAFGDHLASVGGGLRLQLTGDHPHRINYNFLRIAFGRMQGDVAWLEGVRRRLGTGLQPQPATVSTVQSNDRHACSIIFTSDLLSLPSVSEYKTTLVSYQNLNPDRTLGLNADRRLVHCFAAEINSAHLEQGLVPHGEKNEPFPDKVVILLENRDRLTDLIQCVAFQLISRGRAGSDEWWELNTKVVLDASPGGGAPGNGNRRSVFDLVDRDLLVGKPAIDNGNDGANVIRLTESLPQRADFYEAMLTFLYRENDVRSSVNRKIEYLQVRSALDATAKREGMNIPTVITGEHADEVHAIAWKTTSLLQFKATIPEFITDNCVDIARDEKVVRSLALVFESLIDDKLDDLNRQYQLLI